MRTVIAVLQNISYELLFREINLNENKKKCFGIKFRDFICWLSLLYFHLEYAIGALCLKEYQVLNDGGNILNVYSRVNLTMKTESHTFLNVLIKHYRKKNWNTNSKILS